MATKPKSKQDKVATKVQADSRRSDAGDAPFAAKGSNPDTRGEVGEKITTTFDERTGVTQPFVKADGTQDNGAANLEKQEGASRESTRRGDKSTVEETEKAIKEGIVEGEQRIDDAEKEKPKNPVE